MSLIRQDKSKSAESIVSHLKILYRLLQVLFEAF